jgi:hypothetical protein
MTSKWKYRISVRAVILAYRTLFSLSSNLISEERPERPTNEQALVAACAPGLPHSPLRDADFAWAAHGVGYVGKARLASDLLGSFPANGRASRLEEAPLPRSSPRYPAPAFAIPGWPGP